MEPSTEDGLTNAECSVVSTLSPERRLSRAVSKIMVLEAVGNGGDMSRGTDRLCPSIGAILLPTSQIRERVEGQYWS